MTDKAAEYISDSLRKLTNLSSLRLNICGYYYSSNFLLKINS